MGTTQPLIIAPMASNLMGTSLLQNGMQVILTPGQGSNQPTFLIPASTIYSSNTQNYITTHTNQTIQLFNQSRPQFIPQVRNTYSVVRPQRIRAPMQPMYRAGRPPTAYRTPAPSAPQPTAFRSPAVSRTPNTGFRSPAANTGYRTLTPNVGYRTPAPNTGYRTPGPRQVLITQYPMGLPNTPTYIQTNSRLTISTLLECMTILTTQPTKKINMRTILTIKPLPFSWPSAIDDLIASLIKLDNALMKEKFKESPIAWMVTAHLIVPPKCQSCNKGICNQVNKTQSTKYEYWNCNFSKCNASRVIDRPPIFSGPKFDIPSSKLLFIIYYWSIQVDVEDLIKSEPMTTPMMANTASDRELAQLLEEPPRKRRAAALAAQKNWQLLEVDDNPTDDDIIIVEHRQAVTTSANTAANTSHVNNNHNNTAVYPAQRPGPASKKLQHLAQPQVITFSTSSGRSVRSPIVFGGPAGANIRVNQFVINPLTYSNSNNAVNAVKATRSQAQQQSRVNAQPMVRIETENSSRLIPQTPSGQSFKKPVVTKLHANEPIVWPVVDGDVEEIVGTYDVLEEDLNLKLTSEETVNNLDLELFCGPDVDEKEKTSTEKDSDVEVVEETVNGSAATTPKSTPQKKIIPKNKKPIDGHLESVIGSLEMDCENFDDDYTDGVYCECEEDILNFNQWNRSVASKKEFNAYKASVVSTKNVKYLRESEVTEPLGSVTVVVSETSRVLTTTPKPLAVVRMPRSKQNVQTSQSIRNPIPSVGIRHNTPRAPNQYQYRQQSPAQSPMVTSHPITLVPSTSMGTTQPLIIAPMASNLMGTSLLQNGM
ncbi:unnamed protein product, partial [Medioppia subpectinata]